MTGMVRKKSRGKGKVCTRNRDEFWLPFQTDLKQDDGIKNKSTNSLYFCHVIMYLDSNCCSKINLTLHLLLGKVGLTFGCLTKHS